jgi:hypothetical protein
MLIGVTNHTHFPTLTGASRNIAAWSVKPGESVRTDASKPPELPVRSSMKKRKELSD